MKALIQALAAITMAGISCAATAETGGRCDLATAKYVGELQSKLSQRAVRAVNLASATAGDKPVPELEKMIVPNASFSTGGGDVNIPLPSGVAGMIALTHDMNANSFRYLGWDYIPTPVEDPCGIQKTEVEFIDSRKNEVFPVKFTFENGRIISAEAWRRSFESGPIAAIGN